MEGKPDRSIQTSSITASSQRVFLWCVPRSASTAVLKCISNVAGVEAWHEPYTVAQWNNTLYNPSFKTDDTRMIAIRKMIGNPAPKQMELVKQVPRGKLQDQTLFSYPWVKEQLESSPSDGKRHIFVKDMGYGVGDTHFSDLPKNYRHTFLLRDPVAVFQSWKRLIASHFVLGEDLGKVDIVKDTPHFPVHEIYKRCYELWKYAKETSDCSPVVMDTNDLLSHPDIILPKYFRAIGVDYDEKYLRWNASRDIVSEWRGCFEITAVGGLIGIYNAALDSSCFKPRSSLADIDVSSLTSDLQYCINESLPYYREMYNTRIRVN